MTSAFRRGPVRSVLALVDQAAVSGTNFLTTLLVARATNPAELGLYTLAFTLVVLCISTQDSLVITPFTVRDPRQPDDERPTYAGAAFVHQTILGLALSAILALVGAAAWAAGAALGPVVLMAAAAVPFVLLREFGRRFAFTRLDTATACAIDVASGAMQLGAMAWLAWSARLTPVSAHAAAGVACGLAALGWWAAWRGAFRFAGAPVRAAWEQNWVLGRWVLATQLTGVVHGYAVHWLLAMTQDFDAAGVFAACLTVVMLSNPLIFGVANLLAPRAARAATESRAALRGVLLQSAAILVALLGAFAAVAAVYGEAMLALFYGPRYAGNGPIVFVLSVGVLVAVVGIVAEHGLRAAGVPKRSFQAAVAGLVVTVIASAALTVPFGLIGASLGYLIGAAVGTGYRLWMLRGVLAEPEVAT